MKVRVWCQKPTQHSKAIILQLKINFLKSDSLGGNQLIHSFHEEMRL